MLPQEYRLPKNHISELFSSGKRIGNQSVLAVYRYSSEKTSQFIIVIRKKKGFGAVERNRTKRHIREALRKYIPTLKSPIEAVILATPQDNTIDQKVFDSTISMLFNRINHVIPNKLI